ncbi:alanyl-tRNA synthetase [Spiroplasma syrphidicola EA-1]|uniref:Alanine--tRNA ligase n=1 Tax=Spiroplasma syrphidicola EA-1 TaxID=1276229 RepID=R4U6G0_9MOLU|nr:alanine--tRNA ligase [Spiroplasma syrphidicola]AGM26178.1 alanyl-tRNA synthetase [Spiroplasma syrphidicola EA-1]
MKKITSNQIRAMWIEFFKSKNHFELAPCSLIPIDDDSLLWINSGVATLKPYFDGRKTPPAPRLVNSQKSIRTNDIENVGYTARHHTLFEMLGNFSIGDYFKPEAIAFAWEFLTSKEWIGFDPEKLYITIYKEDKEAYDIWHNSIGIPDEKIILGDKDTNFWEIGAGPCGPNTEIFYDRGEKYDPLNLGIKLLQEDIENDRYLEVWNIVFSQFNNNGAGEYSELPRKNIDTGAGLERIVSIVQETPTNFETDLFMPLIKKVEELINHRYQYDINNFFVPKDDQTKINTAFKVIADHIRAVTFAVADGAFPGNKDRGYVIRRLIRRASLYGKKLGLNQAFLYLLVDVVIEIMGDFYHYLIPKAEVVKKAIFDEEEKFLKTLEQGSKLFNEVKDKYHQISKEHAFRLFESYGFPIELIEEEANDANISVDVKGFYELLDKARTLSRTNRKDVKAMQLQSEIFTTLDVNSTFVGYDQDEVEGAKVVFMFANDIVVNELTDCEGYIILDQTPFYAEKGGQASDSGLMTNDKATIQVIDVQQGPNKQHLHYVKVTGTVKLNDLVNATIDRDKRFYTRKNHSGTHLLHAALREVLGNHAMQIGSYNDEERLRIDISHNQPISANDLQLVEQSVQNAILAQIPCEVIYTDLKTALEEHHALAFFTEKYDATVRIIKFGHYSCELCGGTHVTNSVEVEDLLVTGVESKGAGTFRVHAITSHKTIAAYVNDQFQKEIQSLSNYFDKYNQEKNLLNDEQLVALAEKINNLAANKNNFDVLKNLAGLYKEQFKQWQKELEELKIKTVLTKYHALPITTIGDINLLVYQTPEELSIPALKMLIDDYKARFNKIIACLIDDNNPQQAKLVVGVSHDLTEQYQANKIVKNLCQLLEGNGGGNAGLAQCGFKNVPALAEFLANPMAVFEQ